MAAISLILFRLQASSNCERVNFRSVISTLEEFRDESGPHVGNFCLEM